MKKMAQLGFEETHKLLKAYNIPVAESCLAKTKAEAAWFAERIGFPVALKISSKTIIHKTDVGGVVLNLNSKEEVNLAYESIIGKFHENELEGVIVQKMASGQHVIVGMKRDSQFGPVIAFGLGGIFVEIMKDVALRIAPLEKKDAEEMIREIKSFQLLEGARGTSKANLQQIAKIILSMSKLALENNDIIEMDLNPVIADEKNAVAVDARIITGEQ